MECVKGKEGTQRMIQCPDEVEYFLETDSAAWVRHWLYPVQSASSCCCLFF